MWNIKFLTSSSNIKFYTLHSLLLAFLYCNDFLHKSTPTHTHTYYHCLFLFSISNRSYLRTHQRTCSWKCMICLMNSDVNQGNTLKASKDMYSILNIVKSDTSCVNEFIVYFKFSKLTAWYVSTLVTTSINDRKI